MTTEDAAARTKLLERARAGEDEAVVALSHIARDESDLELALELASILGFENAWRAAQAAGQAAMATLQSHVTRDRLKERAEHFLNVTPRGPRPIRDLLDGCHQLLALCRLLEEAEEPVSDDVRELLAVILGTASRHLWEMLSGVGDYAVCQPGIFFLESARSARELVLEEGEPED